MSSLTGGEALVRALADAGVRTIFGIPGVHNLPIYDALTREPRIRHVLARHEQGAGYMADGYARATGEIGVVLTTSGPGALNAITPLATAYADFSPVLCISSQIESYYTQNGQAPFRGLLHEMKDQLGAMSAATGWATRPAAPSAIAGAVRGALQHLGAPRPTPAYLELPFDILQGETSYIGAALPAQAPAPVDAEAAQEFAARLRAATAPLILAGDAVTRSPDAPRLLTALAERLGAPVLTDTLGKGSIPEDHPLALGRVWRRDAEPVNEVLRESDVTLVVGSLLRGKETEEWAAPLGGAILQIDPDVEQLGLNYPASLGWGSEPAPALDALLAQLGEGEAAAGGPERAKRGRDGALAPLRQERGPLLRYLTAIREALPPEGVLCNDMTMLSYAAQTYYPALRPRTFLMAAGFGTLGFALPAAIGARIGKPDTPVVGMCGEGGFQFTMQELATAAQEGVVLPLVVFNDHTYTAVKRVQRQQYERRYLGVDLHDPDLSRLADAYGLRYECTQEPERLRKALTEAFEADRATIVEIPVEVEPW
jgi:acetolactate synthase-1/2/3 large subunit